MWAGRFGPVAGVPLTNDALTAREIVAGILVSACLAIVVLALARAARWLLNRRRLATWEAAWTRADATWALAPVTPARAGVGRRTVDATWPARVPRPAVWSCPACTAPRRTLFRAGAGPTRGHRLGKLAAGRCMSAAADGQEMAGGLSGGRAAAASRRPDTGNRAFCLMAGLAVAARVVIVAGACCLAVVIARRVAAAGAGALWVSRPDLLPGAALLAVTGAGLARGAWALGCSAWHTVAFARQVSRRRALRGA